jgi:type IV fimbrial biogenesis protein FimT
MSRARQAFSLVELVTVIAIIAILSAIAVPRYVSAQQHYRAEAAAHRVISDLTLARSRANTTSSPQKVVFLVAAGQYEMPGFTDPDRPGQTYTVRLADAPYKASLVTADFGGASEVTFDGYGVPNQGGNITVRAGDYERTVVLNANTGKATAQ